MGANSYHAVHAGWICFHVNNCSSCVVLGSAMLNFSIIKKQKSPRMDWGGHREALFLIFLVNAGMGMVVNGPKWKKSADGRVFLPWRCLGSSGSLLHGKGLVTIPSMALPGSARRKAEAKWTAPLSLINVCRQNCLKLTRCVKMSLSSWWVSGESPSRSNSLLAG